MFHYELVFHSTLGSANAALSNVDVQTLLKKLVVSFQRFVYAIQMHITVLL